MEITILKRNADVSKVITVNDEFNFETKKIKFIETNIKELVVNDLLTYCYPIVSYIKYENLREIATKNLINLRDSNKSKKSDIETITDKHTTTSSLDAFDVDMNKIRIPKNTTIQIKSFVLFNDFSKHQTFNRSNKDSIKDLFIKGEFEKIRNYINDNSYIISNDPELLKEHIKNSYDMFNNTLDYINEIFKFKITGKPEDESKLNAIQVDKLFAKKDKLFYFIDSFYFNLILNNKIEAYYSNLLNLTNKTNELIQQADNIIIEKQNKRDVGVLLENKILDEIILNNFASKKFKKKFIQLNTKEKQIINSDYELYKKQYKKITNNKCEHKKLIKNLSNATLEESPKIFHKVMQLADSTNKKDSMVECKLCGFDLICPHKIELNKLQKNNANDTVIRDSMIKHYCNNSAIDKKYYCKICNENIITAEEDENSVFSRVNQAQYNNEVSELSQIIFVDAGFIIKNYVVFSKIININNFIRNIVEICGDKINDISNKLHKNKTTTQQANYNIVKIHIYCYIIATLMFIIVSNPSDIEISLVVKKEKVKVNTDELNLIDLSSKDTRTDEEIKNEAVDQLVKAEEPYIVSENNLLTPVHVSDSKYVSSKDVSSDNIATDNIATDNIASNVATGGSDELIKIVPIGNVPIENVHGGSTKAATQNLKFLFDTGYNIAIKVCNSYLSDANINYNDIKEILSSGFIFIKNNTGGINVKKENKLSDNISSNYNYLLLQKIHKYYNSTGDYKHLLQFDKLKKELPNPTNIKKDEDLIEKLYKNKINIFKYSLIPSKLLKSQDTLFDKACYNLIIMLQSNKNADLNDDLMDEKTRKLDYGRIFRFINTNIEPDNKYISSNDYYTKRKFNKFVLESGDTVNLNDLNKLIKDGQKVSVKDIIDDEGISFFQNKIESYDETNEKIKTKLVELTSNEIKVVPVLESANELKINFKGFDHLNKISKQFNKSYNVLLNLGLTEKYDYDEIVKGIHNPSNNAELSNKTRLIKLHNYILSIISNYNQLKYNIGYKNPLVTELMNIYSKENNISDLINMPDISKFYDKTYIEKLSNSNNTALACQELLDTLFKILFDMYNFANDNSNVLKLFVEKILNYILRSDEVISKENYYELIKKNDNVPDMKTTNADEVNDSDAESNDLELDSNNGEDGDDEEREKKEEEDNDKLDFSNDGFDYNNDESDVDADDDENAY